MRIYVTGGHLTPALAVIDYLQKTGTEKIIFVGREYVRHNPPQKSRERVEIEERGIPFFPIDAAKFHRTHMWRNFQELAKLPLSLTQVLRLMRRYKPDAVLSFGGYVAFPVCLVAKLFGAKILIHEQTRSAGLANQVLALIADKVAVSNTVALALFPVNKTVITGNPLRSTLFKMIKQPPSWFLPQSVAKPILYITGGSQGSLIINTTIAVLLPRLIRDFVIVHQCGHTIGHAYQHELEQAREQLPAELRENYFVRDWVDEKEVSFFLRTAHFVIGRSGANTVEELILFGTPAIFIPLAFAYNDEQYKNVVPILEADASLCLFQKDLIPETLWEKISEMVRRYDQIKAKMQTQREAMVQDGTKRVVELIRSL